MDLSSILKKTERRASELKTSGRPPPSIATEDRPYHEPTNQQQTGNKAPTNWQQSSNQTGNKPATNQQQSSNQTGNKLTTNQQQEALTSQESDNRTSNTSDNKVATNWQQSTNTTSNKVNVIPILNFNSLVGLQRSLIQLMHRQCLERRSRSTGPMSLEHVSHSVKTSKRAAKVTLQRLQFKGFIKAINFKNGRGGWTEYELPDSVFQEVLRSETGNKAATNWQQTGNKVPTQLATELATPVSSSSSSLYSNRTTTTGGPETNGPVAEPANTQTQIDPKWLALDISSLTEIGFTQTHLIQVARDAKLTPEVVQDSIHHFAFDLRVNGKAKELRGPVLNYLMGILRKGFPYAAPENYISPEAEAMKAYLESKKADQERRKTLEDALYELEFANWTRSLSEEEKLNLAPSGGFGGERGLQAKLSGHFRKTVWPALKNNSIQTVPARPNVADSAMPPEVKKGLVV